MVPNFASTAFMMQGCSVDAIRADCGDLWKRCYLPDMTTAHAILSRMKNANGLLPLRKFSQDLFRQGEAAGPKCLMKLLGSHFDNESDQWKRIEEFTTYTKRHAKDDYMKILDLIKKKGHNFKIIDLT